MFCCHGAAGHATPEEITLSSAINFSEVEAFNEATPATGRLVLKQECSRTSKAAYCEAPAGDPELLLNIPFTASVRLRGLCVSGGEGGACARPTRVRLFANTSLDIGEAAGAAATQELELPSADAGAECWHALRVAKFGNVTSLQIYLSGEDAALPMRVYYVGLKAEVGAPKVGVVHAVYEVRAQLSDHKQAEGAAGGGSLLH